jgi:hypothetical protein
MTRTDATFTFFAVLSLGLLVIGLAPYGYLAACRDQGAEVLSEEDVAGMERLMASIEAEGREQDDGYHPVFDPIFEAHYARQGGPVVLHR